MSKKKLSAQDKIDILRFVLLPPLEKQLNESYADLEQAKTDWVQLNSADGDRESVKKNPIFSVIDGEVSLGMAIKMLVEIIRLVGEEQ